MTPDAAQAALAAFLERAGEPKYRAAQIARRLWSNPAPSFDEMTELPKALRESLAASFDLPASRGRGAAEVGRTARRSSFSACTTARRSRASRFRRATASRSAFRRRPDARCSARSARPARWVSAGTSRRSRSPVQVREMRLLDPPIDDHERRVHGHGRAAHELEGRRRRAHDPQRSRRPRDRRAPHHHLHGRRAAGNRRARRTSGAIPPRDFDPRAERLVAARADADQHQVSARRRDSRGEGVRPSRDVRVRDARRRERRSRARDPTRGARARMPRLRQSDSPAPGRRARLHPDERRRHSPLRARAARRGRRGGGDERAAAWTLPRRAVSYGWSASAGGRHDDPITTAISR